MLDYLVPLHVVTASAPGLLENNRFQRNCIRSLWPGSVWRNIVLALNVIEVSSAIRVSTRQKESLKTTAFIRYSPYLR